MEPIKIDENTMNTLLLKLSKTEKALVALTTEVQEIKNTLKSFTQNNREPNALTSATTFNSSSSRKTKLIDPLPDTSKKICLDTEGNHLVVYTDGACENNGKPNAKAGIGVWFGEKHPWNVSEPVKGKATNNTAEIQACIEALRVAHQEDILNVIIKTDSKFVIDCMTQWIHNWKKNGWRTAKGEDVKNKEDLQRLDSMAKQMESVKWVHVRGHKGHRGNEEADALARAGAMRYK